MNDLANILEDAYQNLDQFPPDKQREILDLVDKINETQNKEKARKEFLPFVRAMWPSFIHGRHHEIMAEAFERVARGDLKRLIINLFNSPRATLSNASAIISWCLP